MSPKMDPEAAEAYWSLVTGDFDRAFSGMKRALKELEVAIESRDAEAIRIALEEVRQEETKTRRRGYL
jgi:hypothetical protein